MGGKIYHFTELDSTNDFARGLAEEGTVVVADSQKRGRGRLGRDWYSPEGGLWFSVVLGKVDDLPLSLLAGVALCEVLQGFGFKVKIKWPNDILIGGRKVAGILAELEGERVILGIGLNLNIPRFPDEIKDKATSLLLETGKAYDREEILKLILGELERSYKLLKEGNLHLLLNKWREHSTTLGQEVEVRTPQGRLGGKAIDIAPDGGLILKLPDGTEEKVLAGECSLRGR